MRAACCIISWLLLAASPGLLRAQSTQPAQGELSLQIVTEEGQKLLQARVTSAGKPVENAAVSFFVKRTFGNLLLGQDKTLDDGTAAIPYPVDLPGGPTGQLQIVASATGATLQSPVSAQATFGGSPVVRANPESFPRALWSPQTPWPLIFSIFFIMALVWCTYAFVVMQIVQITRKR